MPVSDQNVGIDTVSKCSRIHHRWVISNSLAVTWDLLNAAHVARLTRTVRCANNKWLTRDDGRDSDVDGAGHARPLESPRPMLSLFLSLSISRLSGSISRQSFVRAFTSSGCLEDRTLQVFHILSLYYTM